MKRIFKILTIPVTLAIDLFTLICIGLISFSGMLLRLVSGIIDILGIAVLVTYSPKNEYSAQDCAPRPLRLSTFSGRIEQHDRHR